MTNEENYWLTTLPAPLPAQPASLPERVDVAVIGGGYTGLAAARALARGGATVAVLEREAIGWGASSRNGGMVLTGLKLTVHQLISKFGLDEARRLFAASLASIDCVERLVSEESIACDFGRSGHLEVAAKPAHYDAFAHDAEVMAREFGHTVRIIPRAELRSEIGSEAYHGGLLDSASAALNPARYVVGLAQAAARAGATLHPRTPAERITPMGGGYAISTTRGTLRAREVLVATNGYSGPLVPALQKRVIPIGSYIIVTEPLPERVAREMNPNDRMIFDTKNFLYYFRLTPPDPQSGAVRLLFGGRANFMPATPATVRESAKILRRGMLSVYPQLRGTAVAYAWGGTLGFTFDILPHAGRSDGLWYALGYGGHGVAMATYLGETLADAILGEPDKNPFAGMRFPTAPLGLYDGRPWFLPFAGLWYRFLDMVS